MSADLKSADVAVVGGGIVGCAVALAARRRGLTVAVLETRSHLRRSLVCRRRPHLRAIRRRPRHTPSCACAWPAATPSPNSPQLLQELSGVSVGFIKGPTIGVARTDDQRQQLLAQVARQLKAGFHVEFIEPDEARRREPLLQPNLTGAALYPDGQVDNQRWPPIVHRALLAADVDVYEGTEVVAVSGGANPAVQTVRGTLNADQIVLATGAWARELLPWVPVVPSKGHMISFDAPHLRARHIIHIPGGSPRPAVRRTPSSTAPPRSARASIDASAPAPSMQMLNGALATLPALADCPLSAIWTGFRPEPEDGLPLIGQRPAQRLVPGHRPPHPRHHHELAHRPNHRPPPHRPRPRLPHPPLHPRPPHLSLKAATRHPGVRSRDPAAPNRPSATCHPVNSTTPALDPLPHPVRPPTPSHGQTGLGRARFRPKSAARRTSLAQGGRRRLFTERDDFPFTP